MPNLSYLLFFSQKRRLKYAAGQLVQGLWIKGELGLDLCVIPNLDSVAAMPYYPYENLLLLSR